MYLFKGTCKQWACRLLHRESVMCQGRLQMICLSFSGPDYLRGSSIPVQLVTMNMHWLLYYWEFLLCNFKTILKLSVLSHAAVEKKNDFMMKSLNNCKSCYPRKILPFFLTHECFSYKGICFVGPQGKINWQ